MTPVLDIRHMVHQIPQMRFLTVALFVQTGIRVRHAAVGLVGEGFAMKIFISCCVFQPPLLLRGRRRPSHIATNSISFYTVRSLYISLIKTTTATKRKTKTANIK
jgi:hypothetical protein